jgi:hypothetical protein
MKEIDSELLCKLVLEIGEIHKKIVKIFPEENEEILKHLAASSIHMVFFMRDFHDVLKGTKTNGDKDLETKFLKDCGCDLK